VFTQLQVKQLSAISNAFTNQQAVTMSSTNIKAIPLPSTFRHDDWQIKYTLLSSSSQSNNQATPQQTLVFIHGTPWSSAVFSPLTNSLLATTPNLTILLYDLPGYGQSQTLTSTSPGPKGFPGSTSIRSQASALAALLSHLSLDGKTGNTAPAVLAHDIAGTIALRAHLLHGCEYSRLMLLDTNVVLPWGDGFYKLAREQHSVFTKLPGHVYEAVVRAVVRSASMREGGLESEWEAVLVRPWVGSEAAQESFVRQIAQADDGDVAEMYEGGMYGSVRCQVTVLWGDGDSWIPRNKMEELCGLLGERLGKPLIVIEGAGHLLMLDQPEKVEEEVRSWLKKM
jgi:pimeloyl-ACP methyl ester carboxylesterase